jgi:hypothetical protein
MLIHKTVHGGRIQHADPFAKGWVFYACHPLIAVWFYIPVCFTYEALFFSIVKLRLTE